MSSGGLVCCFVCNTCGNTKNIVINYSDRIMLDKSIWELYNSILNNSCDVCGGNYTEIGRDYI